MTERLNRDRAAKNPGGMQCQKCDEIFIGEEWHILCGVCDEIERLRNVLEFYASPKNYSDDYYKGMWKAAQDALTSGNHKSET